MGVRGNLPNPDARQPNTGKWAEPKLTAWSGSIPELPERRGPKNQKLKWHPEVMRWYQSWITAPQADLLIGTDWSRLIMCAYMLQDFHTNTDLSGADRTSIMKEIRYTETALGGTVADRIRLRMSIPAKEAPPDPEQPQLASVSPLASEAARRAQQHQIVDEHADYPGVHHPDLLPD